MANDVVSIDNNAAVVMESPNYNKKTGDKVLTLTIKCRPVKTDETEFNSVSVLKYLPVIKDGKNIGKRNMWISLHFTKDAFKGVPNECEVHTPDDLMSGFLYVKAKAVQSPKVYEVKEDEKTGELVFPEAWIKKPNCIVGFEPYVSEQEEFDYHEAPIEAETEEKKMPWEGEKD